MPAWCELTFYEIITVPAGAKRRLDRKKPKEKIIVGDGHCTVRLGKRKWDAPEGTEIDNGTKNDCFELIGGENEATVVRMAGHWGDELGGAGIFEVDNADRPGDEGDRVPYPKKTRFDNHYHDCDEYWIILSGSCDAVSEGTVYRLKPGDCLATGMGHHHDIAHVVEPVKGVYFETTLEGKKRAGHLWEHTHGTAIPQTNRT